jgi:DNA-binding transcriptional regulator GbsR (MarR family)
MSAMAFAINPAVGQLFGSETRARVLGLLADSSGPKTGYELAKALGANASKVYAVLRKLEGTGLLGVVTDRSDYKRYFVADDDLRRFLLKKARITLEKDWFAPRAVGDREKLVEFAKQLRVEIPDAVAKPKNLPNFSEFIRPREKDWALKRVARKTTSRVSRSKKR